MIRKLLVLSAVALAVVPASAFASHSTSDVTRNAAKQCTTLRAKIGATSFGQAFTSFGACVSKLTPLERQNSNNAAAACRAEQADVNFAATHGGTTFARFYGTAHTSKNAFGRCVSTKAQRSSAAEQQSRPNASQTCASLQTSMGADVFAKTYAANENASNAFGMCVTAKARAQVAAELSAAPACRVERTDANFSSTHGGKTFAQFYGTNADDGNAFGKCVSQKAQASLTTQQPAEVHIPRPCGPGPDPGEADPKRPQPASASCLVAKTTG